LVLQCEFVFRLFQERATVVYVGTAEYWMQNVKYALIPELEFGRSRVVERSVERGAVRVL
jgi:hypothetical protein